MVKDFVSFSRRIEKLRWLQSIKILWKQCLESTKEKGKSVTTVSNGTKLLSSKITRYQDDNARSK